MVKMLAPLAPYTAAEMWSRLEPVHGDARNVHAQVARHPHMHIYLAPTRRATNLHLHIGVRQAWPVADGAAVVLEETTVVIQVQGKKRGTVEVPTTMLEDRDAVERIALEAQLLEKYAKGEADAPSPESLVIL